MRSSARLDRASGLRPLFTYIVSVTLLLLGAVEAAGAQRHETMQPMATRADLTALADRLSRGDQNEKNQASTLARGSARETSVLAIGSRSRSKATLS